MVQRLVIALFLVAGIHQSVWAQAIDLPLGRQFLQPFRYHIYSDNFNGFTGVQPYTAGQISLDSLHKVGDEEQRRPQFKSWLFRKVKNEHLVVLDTGEIYVAIDLTMDLRYGRDLSDTVGNIYTNTRGFRVQGYITDRFGFTTSFYENQSFLPEYLRSDAAAYDRIRGAGRTKPFQGTGFDYFYATGSLNWQAYKNVDVRFGQDNHFIGDGYRSLLWSDNVSNYLFGMTQMRLLKGKLQYTWMLNSMHNQKRIPRRSTPETIYQRKAANVHLLSFKPVQQIEIGLFESTIIPRWDSAVGTLPNNFQEFNPVIGLNSAIDGMDARNNNVLGLNWRASFIDGAAIYGQLVWDGPSRGGIQIGGQWHRPLGINGLSIQMEYNQTASNIYESDQHLSDYSHFNQSIAHPSGNGFNEWVGLIDYRFRDFFLSAKMVAIKQFDPDKPYQDSPDWVSSRQLYQYDVTGGYVINPKYQLEIYAGLTDRNDFLPNTALKTQWAFVGLRTSLRNQYLDY